MSGATTLALPRRLDDPRYADRWFVGRGLDIGAGPDGLGRSHTWPNAVIREWDMADGDATTLPGIAAESQVVVNLVDHCRTLISGRCGVARGLRKSSQASTLRARRSASRGVSERALRPSLTAGERGYGDMFTTSFRSSRRSRVPAKESPGAVVVCVLVHNDPPSGRIRLEPSFEMYERGQWPSRIQPTGHKTWWRPDTLYAFIRSWCEAASVRHVQYLCRGFDFDVPVSIDQTTPPHSAECGIEAIVRKPA